MPYVYAETFELVKVAFTKPRFSLPLTLIVRFLFKTFRAIRGPTCIRTQTFRQPSIPDIPSQLPQEVIAHYVPLSARYPSPDLAGGSIKAVSPYPNR